jgi:potassium-dependent mechanosensitive channel
MLRTRTPAASRRHLLLAVTALVACGVLLGTVSAESLPSIAKGTDSSATTAEADPSAETSEALAKRIDELGKRIAATEAAIGRAGQSGAVTGGSKPLTAQRDLMKYLLAVLTQLKTSRELVEELKVERQEKQEELKLLRSAGPSTPPPYSFLTLESLRDQLAAEMHRQESLDAEIATTGNLFDLVRQTHDQRDRERRAARDALKRNHNPQTVTRLNAAVDTTVLTASVAEETMHLRSVQLEEHKIELEINTIRCEYLEEQIRLIAEQVAFPESDLQKIVEKLNESEVGLKQQIEATNSALEDVQQKWAEAKGRLDQNPGDPIVEVAYEAWQVARDSRQKEVAALNQRLAEIAILRTLWQHRYAVFNTTVAAEEMVKWREQVESFSGRLNQARRLADLDFEQCRTELALLESRRNKARQQDSQLAGWLDFQADQLKHLMGTHAKVFLELESSAVLLDRFSTELDAALGIEKEQRFLARACQWAVTAWNYEITAVADEPITVRKLAGALIFLLVGWGISRTVSRVIGRRVLPRFGLDGGNASAVQTIAFYLLFVLFGYFSLELIGVPLTVFAFFGGAMAIGVGFGSQNILNNFISGLILLFERPIRVGDLVEIDGVYGNIEHVGARSTRVKTGSNLEMIIPNSRFLENNVTNLTLSDERFRASVCVGVAYGSPTRTVSQLLERAVLEHSEVLKSPDPIILFKDFADNSLNFEVHFWIRMRTQMQRQRVESDVRHTIDDLFDEAGIVIAFPQRDVHLNATAPIEVRLQRAEAERLTVKRAA